MNSKLLRHSVALLLFLLCADNGHIPLSISPSQWAQTELPQDIALWGSFRRKSSYCSGGDWGEGKESRRALLHASCPEPLPSLVIIPHGSLTWTAVSLRPACSGTLPPSESLLSTHSGLELHLCPQEGCLKANQLYWTKPAIQLLSRDWTTPSARKYEPQHRGRIISSFSFPLLFSLSPKCII